MHIQARSWTTQTLSVVAMLLLMVTQSCGAMFNSNPQPVTITSDPPGAAVFIDGEQQGVTPLTIALSVEKDHDVRVKANGYPESTREFMRSFSAGYLVIDILFGLIPAVVDLATDSLHHLEPEEMHFQFAAAQAPSTTPAFDLKVKVNGQDVDDNPKNTDSQSNFHCCVNKAYHACADAAAVARCVPPELAPCLASCGGGAFSCPEECLRDHTPNTSACTRDSSLDHTCR